MVEISPGLLLIMIIIGNMGLYWLFIGKNKFDKKMRDALFKNSANSEKDYLDLTASQIAAIDKYNSNSSTILETSSIQSSVSNNSPEQFSDQSSNNLSMGMSMFGSNYTAPTNTANSKNSFNSDNFSDNIDSIQNFSIPIKKQLKRSKPTKLNTDGYVELNSVD